MVATPLGSRVSRRERARAATIEEIKATALALMREQGTTDVRFTDIARVMDRKPDARWIALVRRGLAPLTIGLLFSTGWVLARGADSSFSTVALTVATVVVCSFTRVHPLVLVGLGALVGGMGWV